MIENKQNNQPQINHPQHSEVTTVQDNSKQIKLVTSLNNDKLSFDVKIFDFSADSATFYELHLTNENLSEQLRVIFGNTHSLFTKCFLKKQNYSIQGNGRILIRYQVQLQSEKYKGQITLHMISVQKSLQYVLKQLLKKERENIAIYLKEKEDKIAELKNKLIPIKNKYVGFFQLKDSEITYKSPKNSERMIVFDPLLVGTELFSFTVRFLAKNKYTQVGVISSYHTSFRTTRNNKNVNSISFNPFVGVVYRNGAKYSEKAEKLEVESLIGVKVMLDRPNNKVTFKVVWEKQQQKEYVEVVEIINEVYKFYPFVEMFNSDEKIQMIFD